MVSKSWFFFFLVFIAEKNNKKDFIVDNNYKIKKVEKAHLEKDKIYSSLLF